MNKLLLFALLCLPLASCTFEGDTVVDGSIKKVYEITVTPSQWRPVGTPGAPGFYLEAPFNANYITPTVLYDGAVLVYATGVDTSGDVQLPYVLSMQIGASRFVEILGYRVSDGKITFTLDDSDFQTAPLDFNVTFKIVVIE